MFGWLNPFETPVEAYKLMRDSSHDADANIKNPQYNKDGIRESFENVLTDMDINWENDPATRDTPDRISRMFKEVCWGKYTPKPKLTDFECTCCINQMYSVGPIEIRSMCSHHLVPIMGQVWIGVLPTEGGRVLGLSKFARLTEWAFARPIMQENTTFMLANEIWDACELDGLGIVVRAQHMCASWRGVQQTNMSMITTALKGLFLEDFKVKSEFYNLIKGQGF